MPDLADNTSNDQPSSAEAAAHPESGGVERIDATETTCAILERRDEAVRQSKALAQQAQLLSNETFTIFCHAHGLPDGCAFVGIEGNQVLISRPPTTP